MARRAVPLSDGHGFHRRDGEKGRVDTRLKLKGRKQQVSDSTGGGGDGNDSSKTDPALDIFPSLDGFINAHLQMAVLLKRTTHLKEEAPPTATPRCRIECCTEEHPRNDEHDRKL